MISPKNWSSRQRNRTNEAAHGSSEAYVRQLVVDYVHTITHTMFCSSSFVSNCMHACRRSSGITIESSVGTHFTHRRFTSLSLVCSEVLPSVLSRCSLSALCFATSFFVASPVYIAPFACHSIVTEARRRDSVRQQMRLINESALSLMYNMTHAHMCIRVYASVVWSDVIRAISSVNGRTALHCTALLSHRIAESCIPTYTSARCYDARERRMLTVVLFLDDRSLSPCTPMTSSIHLRCSLRYESDC